MNIKEEFRMYDIELEQHYIQHRLDVMFLVIALFAVALFLQMIIVVR